MHSKQTPSVHLNFGPLIPKTDQETFMRLVKASEEIAKYGRAYLERGDIDDARRMMNARLAIKGMATKQPLPRMECSIIFGSHPLDETARAAALSRLKESDGETGL